MTENQDSRSHKISKALASHPRELNERGVDKKMRLLLLGGGGHARSCIEAIESEGIWKIIGILEEGLPNNHSILGYRILGRDREIERVKNEQQVDAVIITIGQIKSAEGRIRLYKELLHRGMRLATVTASTARVSFHASIGLGTVVMHGAFVNAGSVVGANCILNSHCLIEHDCQIEAHCHVSTKAVINGGVKLGKGSFIGSGTIVREGVSIGPGCIVGAGSLVLNDLPAGVTVKGNS